MDVDDSELTAGQPSAPRATDDAGDVHPRLGYHRELDGIRGLAVTLVVLAHSYGLHNGGALGVEIFFVLSGFLITTLLLEELAAHGRVSFPRFYARRALRLLPALYLLLAVVAVVALTLDDRRWYLASIATCVLYVGNMVFWVTSYPGLARGIGHLWSLAVEEQFYLAWPFVLVLLVRRFGEARAARWVLGLAIAAVLVRSGYRIGRPGVWGLPWAYGDALFLGALLAFVRRAGRLGRWPTLAAILLPASVLIASILPETPVDDHLSLVLSAWAAIGGLAVLTAFSDGRVARLLRTRPLVRLGYLSYGLYLVHYPIAVLLFSNTTWSVWVRGTIVVITSLAIAAASRMWFEAWFLRRKPGAA